jgi:hypothetical protein
MANHTRAFGDLPAAPETAASSASASAMKRLPRLNCASLSPAAAFCIKILDPTPLQLIKHGSVVEKFVSHKEATLGSTCVELPNDDYNNRQPDADFNRREQESSVDNQPYMCMPPLIGFNYQIEVHNHPELFYNIALMVPIVTKALFTRMEKKDGVMCFGHTGDGVNIAKLVRKRMLWCALILYQRAVMFFLRTFAQVIVKQTQFTQHGASSIDVDSSGSPDKLVKQADRIYRKFNNNEHRKENLALRYSMWAACGGFEDLFDVFNGMENCRHFRLKDGCVNPDLPLAVLRLYERVSAEGKRAPIQYAQLPKIHAAAEKTLVHAFIASSDVSYYSYTLEQALAVLDTS